MTEFTEYKVKQSERWSEGRSQAVLNECSHQDIRDLAVDGMESSAR